MITPKCFSTQQFREWRELASATKINPYNYCRDCTPEYKNKMAMQGKCAHPETIFYWILHFSRDAWNLLTVCDLPSKKSVLKLMHITRRNSEQTAKFKERQGDAVDRFHTQFKKCNCGNIVHQTDNRCKCGYKRTVNFIEVEPVGLSKDSSERTRFNHRADAINSSGLRFDSSSEMWSVLFAHLDKENIPRHLIRSA